jgi:hypothetical protein
MHSYTVCNDIGLSNLCRGIVFYDGIEEILTVLIVHEATNLRMVNITFGKCKAPSTFHGTINTMLMP